MSFSLSYSKKNEDKIERWAENELKAYYWTCVALSCILEKGIEKFVIISLDRLKKSGEFYPPFSISSSP